MAASHGNTNFMAAQTQISLGELARLTFPPDTRLPDEPYRDRIVQWVVMAGPGVVPRAGDCALCGVPPTAAELREWADQEVAAVVLAEAGAVRAKSPVPIFRLPAGASLRDLQQAALQVIVNRQAYLIDRGARLYRDLSRLSLEGAGLAGLTQAMHEQSGKTILLQDKRLRPLAEAVAPDLTSDWPALKERLGIWSQLPESLRDRRQAAVGDWREQSLPGGELRLVCPVVVTGVARGYLSIIGSPGELDALDHLIVEHGAAACALEMAKVKAVSDAEKRAYGDFLDAVLTRHLPPEELIRWAQRIGFDTGLPHSALIWRWGAGPAAPTLRRLETIVNQSIAKAGLNAMARPRGEEIVIFCTGNDPARPETALALAETIRKAAEAEYPDTPLHGGIGRPAPEIVDWPDAHREAAQALSIAVRIGERRALYFGDLSVYRLLFQLNDAAELEAFCRETLGPLMDYEGSGDLLETLEAFCERLGNLSQTAERLFIHRNSLLYRMERIQQLAGIDMNNPDTRLAVHLALKIRRMLRPPATRRSR